MCPLNITFLYKFLYLTSKHVPLILRYYKQLKNFRISKTYVFQENIMITTEKNSRERKNCLDGLFCPFFCFVFKSYLTKLPSKFLTLTSLVSFLFIENITGRTAFIQRSKLFLCFVFWNCQKFEKKNLKSVSLYSYRLFTENMKFIKSNSV